MCQIQIASHCTLVSVLLHGPTSYDCPRTDSSPRPATFQLRYNDVHVRVWFATGRHVWFASFLQAVFCLWTVIQQHAEPNTLPTRKSTFCNSTRTRRALRHPSISRQTYHRDKVGPPNPQANQESCVSFPFRTEITRPELPAPPPPANCTTGLSEVS